MLNKQVRDTFIQAVLSIVVLYISLLTASQIWHTLHLGHPPTLVSIPVLSSASIVLVINTGTIYASSFAVIYLNRHNQEPSITNHWFVSFVIALGLCVTSILILDPTASLVAILYFTIISFILGIFLVLLPGYFQQIANGNSLILDHLREILKHRYLIQIWARFRIQVRYTETLLGILWLVLFPILESLVLAFAFSQLLGRGERGGVPMVLFLLSGRVAFIIFRSLVQRATNAIQNMSGIIQQVYFPREVIIGLNAAEVMVDFLFGFLGFVLIALPMGLTPNIYYVLLPIPIVIMLALSMGIAFIVAWLGLIIRDINQLVIIGLQLLFYVTVFFDATSVAPELLVAPLVNPVSGLVEAVRSILIYEQMPHLPSLLFPTVLSVGLLYTGYLIYKSNEDRFTDYV